MSVTVDPRERLIIVRRTSVSYDFNPDQPRTPDGKWGFTGVTATRTGKPVKEGGEGTKMVYHDSKGKALPEKDQERLRALGIGPGWTHIALSKDPNADRQAVGTTTRVDPKTGKTIYKWQSKYTAAKTDKGAQSKWARVQRFIKDIPKLNTAAQAGLAKGDHTAAATRLVLLTGLRPGSRESAERVYTHSKSVGTGKLDARGKEIKERVKEEQEGHFGITSLQKEHVSVRGSTISLSFNGKHGVDNERTITDPKMASFLKTRLAEIKPGQPVFQTNETKVLAFVKSATGVKEYKTKDIRTWQGTTKAIELIGNRRVSDEKGLKALQKEVSKGVSEHLCNSPTMALKSYISPFVWSNVVGVK